MYNLWGFVSLALVSSGVVLLFIGQSIGIVLIVLGIIMLILTRVESVRDFFLSGKSRLTRETKSSEVGSHRKGGGRRPFKGKCDNCKSDIRNFADCFCCRYCHKWHCAKCRIPENHGCKNPKKPEGFTSSPITYSRQFTLISPI